MFLNLIDAGYEEILEGFFVKRINKKFYKVSDYTRYVLLNKLDPNTTAHIETEHVLEQAEYLVNKNANTVSESQVTLLNIVRKHVPKKYQSFFDQVRYIPIGECFEIESDDGKDIASLVVLFDAITLDIILFEGNKHVETFTITRGEM